MVPHTEATSIAATRPAPNHGAGRFAILAGALLVLGGTAATVVTRSADGPGGPAPVPAPPPDVTVATGEVPLRVDIPAIGVSAAVDPLGLRTNGRLVVPSDYGRVGWYAGSHAPGGSGPAVLLGHVDDQGGPAVFHGLDRLRPGDPIAVTRADDATMRFVVERSGQFRKRNFPTEEVYGPTSAPTLRLVTCAGPYKDDYRDNLVVFARMEYRAA